ncbi:MAG: GNAT family N-acetyltransferase, partial [Gemmatimonadales bacterium]|nr:GNAT family N-acetyltransferase [Gemmatimonadales bacterium]
LRQAEWLYDHFVDHVVYAMLASEWTGTPRRRR